MRMLWIGAVSVLAFALTGCGKKAGNEPVEAAVLTPEQVKADIRNQKEAAGVEAKRLTTLSRIPVEHSEAEEAERLRDQQRR